MTNYFKFTSIKISIIAVSLLHHISASDPTLTSGNGRRVPIGLDWSCHSTALLNTCIYA